MKIIDYENLSDLELISHLILERKGKGFQLPYEDYQIISNWLEMSEEKDILFETLEEVLPKYFPENKDNSSKSLRGLNRKVTSILKNHR